MIFFPDYYKSMYSNSMLLASLLVKLISGLGKFLFLSKNYLWI